MEKNSNPLITVVAFVEDNDTKDLIESLPAKFPELSVQVFLGGVKGAIGHLQSHPSPQIMLVDISKSELALSDMQGLSDVCEPGVEVVCIGEKNEVGLFRDLIDLGVRDYIVKPLTVSLLMHRFQPLSKPNPGMQENADAFLKQGKTIAFMGVKGGLGTSTLAANCAWILAEKAARKVSLIDLDMKYGALGQFFNVNYTQRFTELLKSSDKIDEIFVDRMFVKFSDHLSIVSSLDPLNLESKSSQESIEKVLALLRKKYNYILYDVPRDISNITNMTFLENADIIALVTDFTLFSIRDTIRVLEHLWNERKNSNQRIVLIANRVGEYKRGQLEQHDFEETITQKIDVVLPFDSTRPLTAMNEGVLVASLDGALSQALYKLASNLIEKEVTA